MQTVGSKRVESVQAVEVTLLSHLNILQYLQDVLCKPHGNQKAKPTENALKINRRESKHNIT